MQVGDLGQLLDGLFDMATRTFTYQIVLYGLLVAHFFDKICNLLHGCLHLGHHSFLSFKSLLFFSALSRAKHFYFCVEPGAKIFFILCPE